MNDLNWNIKVLMIDDDEKLCRLVCEYLVPFSFNVTAVFRGDDGVEAVRNDDYDVVILDVMLPGMDGFEVLRQIRNISDVPVLMLTALGDEADRIVGLEIGADDYLPKTFSSRELLARLRAATRRSKLNKQQDAFEKIALGDLVLDKDSRTVELKDHELELTSLEFDLLYCLVKNSGRVLSRDHILDEIAGRNYDIFDRSIDVHISSLRRKLGDDPKHPRFIMTVRSVGYKFLSTFDCS